MRPILASRVLIIAVGCLASKLFEIKVLITLLSSYCTLSNTTVARATTEKVTKNYSKRIYNNLAANLTEPESKEQTNANANGRETAKSADINKLKNRESNR